MQAFFQNIGNFFRGIFEKLAVLKPFENPYVQFVAIVIVAIGIAVVMQAAIRSRNLKNIKNKTIRKLLEKSFSRNVIILGVMSGIYFSLNKLHLNEQFNDVVKKITLSLILLFSFFVARILIRFAFELITQPRKTQKAFLQNKGLTQFGKRLAQIVAILIVVTVTLDVWGVKVGGLLAGLGIAGIAVGLALQDSLSNIFGGISLILDDVYREDELIEIENGTIGTVYAIGYRSTKLRTINEEIVNVPNGKLSQMNVKNLSRPGSEYRLSIDVGVAYGSDPEYVKQVILDELAKIPGVLDFPEPAVLFMNMGDYSLKFLVLAYIQNATLRNIMTDKILTALYTAFATFDIKIPFPTTTVYLDKTAEE